jgi:uncharacterized membrane protein YhiD involved in acid resistance
VIELSSAVIRLGLALAFGAAIGIEREWRLKQAGLKTMSLVAMGSAAFGMLSDTFGADNHNPGQIAAAVVGGIGFLGAGVIMHRGLTVQGLTTAATLWASASVGVAVGVGQVRLAVVLTAMIVVIQVVGRSIEQRVRALRRREMPGRFEMRVECDGEALHAVNAVWEPWGPPVQRTVSRGLAHLTVRVVLRAQDDADISTLQEQLVAVDGVRRVDIRHLGVEEEP